MTAHLWQAAHLTIVLLCLVLALNLALSFLCAMVRPRKRRRHYDHRVGGVISP